MIQVGIGVFWLATMGFLIRDVYFEQGNRLAEANVDFVLDTLYNWSDSANLTLTENGRNIGRLTISAAKDLNDPENGPRRVSINALIEGRAREQQTGSIRLRGAAMLDADRELLSSEIRLLQGQNFSAYLRMEGEPAQLEARVEVGNQVLIDHTGDAASFAQSMPALPMGMALPMPTNQISGLSTLFDGITAWQGTTDFDGRNIPVFVLKKEVTPDQEIRIFLTEAGEPLKVETDIGIEAISNILMPQEAPLVGLP